MTAPIPKPLTLVDKLRAMMADIRKPGEVETLDAAIERIEAADEVANPPREGTIAAAIEWYEGPVARLRALVREQEVTDAS